MSKNTNCLEGIRCPECGQDEVFDIVVSTTVRVTDEGFDLAEYSSTEWDEYSSITCPDCEKSGEVADFSDDESVVPVLGWPDTNEED